MSVKGICVVLSALVCGASAVVTVTRLRGNQDSVQPRRRRLLRWWLSSPQFPAGE